MRFIIAAAATVLPAFVAAEPVANPEPQLDHTRANHGLARRWSGYGTWGCGCPLYGGFSYGVGGGYGVGTGIYY
ncbi:hypothetical protein GGH94_004617 [Coemansia aciculifera]|uniref:Uncharacterized protein n=1 Tax=Coemansia aciculifera TaxID=417176 RepID=A0A9W8IHE9_9FUNG|nr:hypothetical protein GGH94_004617 [Coemansia aciculifera]